MTPWFLQRAHFGERCVMDPIGGIGDDLISVEEGLARCCEVRKPKLLFSVRESFSIQGKLARGRTTAEVSIAIHQRHFLSETTN